MQFPRSNPKEHVDVILLLGSLPLKFTDVANVLEFCFTLLGIVAAFSAQPAKNVPGFVVAAHLDQPAGGFGHQKDDGEKQQEWCDLEGDGKAPDEI